MRNKIDIKIIFILILAIGLILSLIFRPSKGIDIHKDELKQLELDNKILKNEYDSIKLDNENLNQEIQILIISIDSTESVLIDTEGRLNDLENEDSKVSDYVRDLDADGISRSLTEFLNKQ